MTLMDTLIRSATPGPPKILVFGEAGVGKTSLARDAGALLIDCENGASAVTGLIRTPFLASWPEMRAWLVELTGGVPEEAACVAIDTLDWMVQRIVEHVVIELDGKKQGDVTNTLASAHGGYFKAREIVQNIVSRDLLPMLNAINDAGVPILLLAHAANTKVTTPEGFEVRLASPDLPQWIAPLFVEWADAVLYAHRSPAGERVLATEGSGTVLAKNRYALPPSLPLSWDAVVRAIEDSPAAPSLRAAEGGA